MTRTCPETTILAELASWHAEWSRDTFGPDDARGPLGPLRHLKREADETIAAPSDPSEYADLFLLVLDAARRAGLDCRQLVLAASRKLAVNMARTWPDWRSLPSDMPVEHVAPSDHPAAPDEFDEHFPPDHREPTPCDPGTMDATAWAFVRCDSCPEECNCHPAGELRMARTADGGFKPICEDCFDSGWTNETNWFAMPLVSIGAGRG